MSWRACGSPAKHGIDLAVRGGGHNAGGLGVWDDALVVDLSVMRGTKVDPAAHTVQVEGGCTWADVDGATGEYGMATPSGFLASTGVGGLTLGGGIGYLTRRFGLTIDNLLSAEVVLADGTLVTASSQSHPDLFWALRGGGGNFGVVTSFRFCLPRHRRARHDHRRAGPVRPGRHRRRSCGGTASWCPALPEELSGWLGLITIPPAPPFPEELWGRKSCAIVWCYTGPHDGSDEVLAPIRDFGSPLLVGLQRDAVRRAAERVRRPLPGGSAVVLAG